MKFEEALALLREGRLVRREQWNKPKGSKPCRPLQMVVTEEKNGKGEVLFRTVKLRKYNSDYCLNPSVADIFAEDWEEVDLDKITARERQVFAREKTGEEDEDDEE